MKINKDCLYAIKAIKNNSTNPECFGVQLR